MNRIILRRILFASIAGGCSILLVAGCGSSSRAYAPSPSTARESLDAALATWQKGGKADQLASASPPIHAVDFQWQARQVLESYEILEEQPGSGDAEKRYAVRLKLKKPLGEKRVQYIIIGREPIWVFRDEDYARTSDMADNPRPGRRRRP
jgi:hypothetical protein